MRYGLCRGVLLPTKKQLKVEFSLPLVKSPGALRNSLAVTIIYHNQPHRAISFGRVPRQGGDGGPGPAPTAGRARCMTESERLSKLRHDLSNPLSALLAETQLLLLNESQIDPETLSSLREIEALAIRMRAMLRDI